MKRIYYIARNELYSLYYSPIAWIMMVLFLILTGSDYIGSLFWPVSYFERGGPVLMLVQNLTDGIVTNPLFGYFPKVIANLYIFFPLITMGLISRETSSGTIKLLYSSPVRTTEIVLGKFLAMVCFTLSLIVLLLFTVAGVCHSLTHPDYGHIVAAVFGLFLVLCTYAAIGLFISSLTSYQIVAAIITLAIFAFLSKVGGLWQDIDIIRNITYYMNIGWKSQDLLNGLYNTRDISYFLILIAGFISFTIIRIKSSTESVSNLRKVTRYTYVIFVGFALGYLTNKPSLNLYWDTTRDKMFTITPPTRTMLSKLNDGPLEISVFGNLLGDFSKVQADQQNSIISSIWEPYIRFKPDIDIKFVYYYNTDTGSWRYKLNPGKSLKEISEKEAGTYNTKLSHFLDSTQVNRQVNTNQEEYRNFFLLKYKNRTAIVRTFDDPGYWPGEDEIAAAINRLIATPPKIDFLTDEIERGPYSQRPRDYKMIAYQLNYRRSLINQGYDFDTLSLKDHDRIPTEIAGLVIADPRTAFNSDNLKKINTYINSGGNLLITTEPDRKQVVQPLLDTLGIFLRNGLLIQPNANFSSDCVFPYLSGTAENFSPQFRKSLDDQIKYFGDSLFRVAMIGAGALDYKEKNGFHISPLLFTDPTSSWNRTAPVNSDSLQLKVDTLPSDQHGNFVTSVLLTRRINGHDQRIIVSGDADYLTKTAFDGWDPRRFNYDFGFWSFSKFSYGKFPANTLRPQTDDQIAIKTADIPFQKILLVYILPAIIALIGSILLIRPQAQITDKENKTCTI